MGIIPYKISIVIISTLIAINCNGCKEKEIFFETSAEVFDYYPKRNTFYVGDTIFFKITIPKDLKGVNDYSYTRDKVCTIKETDSLPMFYNLMLYMNNERVGEVFIEGPFENSLSKERVVNIKGRLTDSKEVPSIFERADSNYVLEIGYIFKYAGGGGYYIYQSMISIQ